MTYIPKLDIQYTSKNLGGGGVTKTYFREKHCFLKKRVSQYGHLTVIYKILSCGESKKQVGMVYEVYLIFTPARLDKN
jgi:hypothetical protein